MIVAAARARGQDAGQVSHALVQLLTTPNSRRRRLAIISNAVTTMARGGAVLNSTSLRQRPATHSSDEYRDPCPLGSSDPHQICMRKAGGDFF